MKKVKKRKVSLSKIFLVMLIILFILYLCFKFTMSLIETSIVGGSGKGLSSILFGTSEYDIIKEDYNENYDGKRTRES